MEEVTGMKELYELLYELMKFITEAKTEVDKINKRAFEVTQKLIKYRTSAEDNHEEYLSEEDDCEDLWEEPDY